MQTPREVQVKSLADTVPSTSRQPATIVGSATSRAKKDVATPIAAPKTQRPDAKGASVLDRGAKVASDTPKKMAAPVQAPKAESKATPKQEHKASRMIDPAKTALIAGPLQKLKTVVLSKKDFTGTKRAEAADTGGKTIVLNSTTTVKTPDATTKTRSAESTLKSDGPAVKERITQGPVKEQRPADKDLRAADSSPRKEKRDRAGLAEETLQPRMSKETQRPAGDRLGGPTKPARNAIVDKTDVITSNRSTMLLEKTDRGTTRFRPPSTRKVIYEDRSRIVNRAHHHDYTYRDRRHRLCDRIIWPRFWFPVFYDWGHHCDVHYVYPYYHRRYVFVSLGGFWPDYTCVRYYWYPSHSFWWYGYDPIPQEVAGDTYNYYTYNYYGRQPAATGSTYDTSALTPVDGNTFADVREKLSRQQAPAPDAQTAADALFDEGVKSFEQACYAEAAEQFARAMELAPDDMILPFAYAQALFADGKYSQAADALRLALQKGSPDKQGVFYPRGLYLDENTLVGQIDRLADEAESRSSDTDLQLLLGYQWLGIGETDRSLEPLNKAKEDYKNFGAAATLLELAEKIKSGDSQ